MKNLKPILLIGNLILFLLYFNWSVIKKEQLINDGQLILLELAPVDPRSLMQGDYMQLRYALSENLNIENIPKRGYCIVKLDSGLVAKRVRFQKNAEPIKPGEYAINYTAPNEWNVNIGAESYFFQEGEAKKFETAKYGGIKIDDAGNSILVGLYNEKQQLIK